MIKLANIREYLIIKITEINLFIIKLLKIFTMRLQVIKNKKLI